MTHTDWEKSPIADQSAPTRSLLGGDRWKFVLGGVVLLIAVGYLVLSGTATGAQYFMTIEELASDSDNVGKPLRISGAVDGNTIIYDSENLIMEFEIAHIPSEFDDLARALYEAVNDPQAARLQVIVDTGDPKPDLLQHEAQAILTGRLGADGIFYADELLLKCPSRYEEAIPDQVHAADNA
jgi:cytochrome c-type biogenesis protein CcmE